MTLEEYLAHDATGLAERVAAKEVTPQELLTLARERSAQVNSKLNAIITPMDTEADAIAGGELSGPFAGVPFLLKDLGQDYMGLPTAGGCSALRHVPAQEHATVVQRWLDAGLVPFGKTNTPEFGAKAITESEAFGPARNPWNTQHTPGGSSGGSAAAVAAGIVPCAGASDGGGSIRIPAACCGLFGLKAGRGLVPSGPLHGEGLGGSSTNGVVSRSVRDSAAMLDVLAGPAPASPYLPATIDGTYLSEIGQAPGKLKIAYFAKTTINPTPDGEAIAAVDGTVHLLESLGHEVTELPRAPFDDAQLAEDFLTGWFAYCAWGVAETKAATGASNNEFENDTLIMAALGRGAGAVAFCSALERKQDHVRKLAEFHEQYDLLLTPSLATPPPKVGAFEQPAALRALAAVVLKLRAGGLLRHTSIVRDMIEKNLGWVPYTQLANITGRPATSVPLHWTAAGLPLGVQFVGRLGSEGQLLRLAAELEQAQPWAEKRPSI
jgi:Asp-tRNA(Asn)/Glu-tRNA(Gln) amidotransferase A subunit family amidase